MKDIEVDSVTVLSMKQAKISKLKLWKKQSFIIRCDIVQFYLCLTFSEAEPV